MTTTRIIKTRRLAKKVIDRAGRFRAGKSASGRYECEQLTLSGFIFLERGVF
jgi:hypothetical protein